MVKKLYTIFSSGSVGIVLRLITSSSKLIDPLSARKSPARKNLLLDKELHLKLSDFQGKLLSEDGEVL